MSMKVKNIDLSPTMYAPTLPYNPLSPLPPASDVESTLVLKRCVGARAALASLLRTEAPKIYPRELVKLIFSQPCCRIADVTKKNIAKRQGVYSPALHRTTVQR